MTTAPGSTLSLADAWGGMGGPSDYRRKMAALLMSKGIDASPVQSGWQGAARLAQALVGGLEMNSIDKAEKAYADTLLRHPGLSPAPGSTPPTPAAGQPQPQAPARTVDAPMPPPGALAQKLERDFGVRPQDGTSLFWSDADKQVQQQSAATMADPADPRFVGPQPSRGPMNVTPQQGPGSTTDRIIGVESGGNPNAKNPRSSATGAGQFIKSTWLDMVGRHRPDLAQQYKNPQDILALRSDPQLSREMTTAYADENNARLQSQGLPVRPGTTYLAHFAGPAGASAVLRADPSMPVASVLGQDAIRANPFLRGMTAGQLVSWADRKMGGAAAAPQGGPEAPWQNPPQQPSAFNAPPQQPAQPPHQFAQAPRPATDAPQPGSAAPTVPPQVQEYARRLIATRNPQAIQQAQQMLDAYMKPGGLELKQVGDSAVVFNPRDGSMRQVPFGTARPEFTVIGQDEFGRPRYGFVDKNKNIVSPYDAPKQPPPPGEPAIPPAPPGVDPKQWREERGKRVIEESLPASDDRVQRLRKEIQDLPSYKNIAQAAPVYKSMVDAASRDNRAADVNLIYGMAKIMDPGSVVRESEMTVAQAVATLPQGLQAQIKSQLLATGRLDPEVRAAIMQEARSRISAYQSMFDQDAGMYRGIAERGRMKVEDVLPTFGPFEEFKPGGMKPQGQPGAAGDGWREIAPGVRIREKR